MPTTRPRSATVFGILNIVFSACGVIGTITTVAALTTRSDNPALKMIQDQPVYMAWTKISIPLSLVMMAMLLTSGIGLLRMKPWARKLSIGYGIVAIIAGLCSMILTFLYIVQPVLQEAAGKQGTEAAQLRGQALGTVLGSCGSLIFPILLLIFMTRPKLVQAYSPLRQ